MWHLSTINVLLTVGYLNGRLLTKLLTYRQLYLSVKRGKEKEGLSAIPNALPWLYSQVLPRTHPPRNNRALMVAKSMGFLMIFR